MVYEVGWAPGPVWMGADNLAPPGFVARSESTYRLSYPGLITGVERCFPAFLLADPVWFRKATYIT